MSDKELRELYVGKYKGKDKHLSDAYNIELKRIMDRTKGQGWRANRAAKQEVKQWLQARRTAIAAGEVSLEEAENFIYLYKNEERLTSLRADFGQMMGKVAKFKKKGIKVEVDGVETLQPGLIARSPSRLLGMKKDVVEQVANSSKWQKIFAANPQIKEELLGQLVTKEGTLVREGGQLQNMLDNLNDIFHRAFVSYQKQDDARKSMGDILKDASDFD